MTASNSFAVIVKPSAGDAGAARQVGDTIVKAEGIKELFESVKETQGHYTDFLKAALLE
jgi:hypothetical protein